MYVERWFPLCIQGIRVSKDKLSRDKVVESSRTDEYNVFDSNIETTEWWSDEDYTWTETEFGKHEEEGVNNGWFHSKT